MAECADTYTVTTGDCTATTPNSVAISSPTVFQYPKPPRDNTGKWAALGGMIGAVIAQFANQDKLDEASDAEDKWKEINRKLDARGQILFDRATLWRKRSDDLTKCTDDAFNKLCCLLSTGYKPDYSGILSRAVADSQAATSAALRELKRGSDRYHTGINAHLQCEIVNAGILATVATAAAGREAERQFTWLQHVDLSYKAVTVFENARNGRDARALENDTNGGDFLSSAGSNYSYLAESLRRSAKLSGSTLATLGSMAGLIIPMLFGCSLGLDEECCPEAAPA